MSGAEYYRLVFGGTQGAKWRIHPEKPFRVFESLYADQFAALSQTLAQDMESSLKPDGIQFRPAVWLALSRALQSRVRQLLAPILQANYKTIIEQAVASGAIAPKRTISEETEIRQWFLTTMQQAGIARLFAAYPYVEQATQRLVRDWYDDTRHFIERLVQDIDTVYVAANLPRPTMVQIRTVRCDTSDLHAGGQTVKIIQTNEARFVYKPRSLTCETQFYQLLGDLEQRGLPTTLHKPWTIDKQTYGWMEYCAPLRKAVSAAAGELAQQSGALAAVWFLLGGTDLHQDNLLFTTQGVVIVDCETMCEADLHYTRKARHQAPSSLDEASAHSPLATHAFSLLMTDPRRRSKKLREIGGIMQYQRLLQRSPLSSKVRAREWHHFVDIVAKSTTATLRFLTEQPIANLVYNRFAGTTPARIILRPTRGYAAILHNLSRTVQALQETVSAERYIGEQLDRLPLLHQNLFDTTKIKRAEIASLLCFDIPYFGRTIGRNQLYIRDTPVTMEKLDFSALHARLQWLQDPDFIRKAENLIRRNLLLVEQNAKDYSTTR